MKAYLKACKTDVWKQVFEKELEYILRELKSCKTVLSVGCGPAIIERGLQENGFEVTGLDVSKEAFEGAPDNIRKIIGSAESMKFEDSSFDAVIYIAALQFINDYEKAIKETARVLKPKKKFLVMLLNPESEFFKSKTRQPDSYINKIKHPYLKPIQEIIQKYFNVIKTEYYLGVRNQEIFTSQHPKSAALYVILGAKK